jgi:hypothetical protein
MRKQIADLCRVFGVDFNGDVEFLVHELCDDYGGLSFLDWALFFDRCAKKRYVNDYQHITTRGINSDFLLDWLQQYIASREETFDGLLKDAREKILTTQHSEPDVERLAAIRVENGKLLAAIETRLDEYERSLVTEEDQAVDIDGRTGTVRIRVDRPGAAYQRVFDFIYLYQFGGDEIGTSNAAGFISEYITEPAKRRHELSQHFEGFPDLKAWLQINSKQVIREARRLIEGLGPHGVLTQSFTRIIGDLQTPAEFHQKVFGSSLYSDIAEQNTAHAWGAYFAAVAGKIIDEFRSNYAADMRHSLQSPEGIVFRERDYLLFSVLRWLRERGIETPLDRFWAAIAEETN